MEIESCNLQIYMALLKGYGNWKLYFSRFVTHDICKSTASWFEWTISVMKTRWAIQASKKKVERFFSDIGTLLWESTDLNTDFLVFLSDPFLVFQFFLWTRNAENMKHLLYRGKYLPPFYFRPFCFRFQRAN